MQKYRIFYSDRVIKFTSNQQWTPRAGRIILLDPSVSDLHRWLKKIKYESGIQEVTVQVEDPAGLFQEFIGSMKKIESSGGIVSLEGKVLFIYRFGRWDLPKGKMEKGESPGQTALREVEEECGIGQLKLEERFSDTFHIYIFEGQYVVKQTYWFGMSTTDSRMPQPQYEEGIEEVAWIDPAQWSRVVLPQTYSSLLPLLDEASYWLRPKVSIEKK
jgi:8-oxo-dGTP pyrophosphatase MutT (NUDIX family)